MSEIYNWKQVRNKKIVIKKKPLFLSSFWNGKRNSKCFNFGFVVFLASCERCSELGVVHGLVEFAVVHVSILVGSNLLHDGGDVLLLELACSSAENSGELLSCVNPSSLFLFQKITVNSKFLILRL